MYVDNLLNIASVYWFVRNGEVHNLFTETLLNTIDLNFRSGLEAQLLHKPGEHVVVVVHVQHWDIENLFEVRGLHTAYHRRGSWNFWNFQEDGLLLKDERRKQDIVHLFNHSQHWGIEGQDVLVSNAAVPLHLPMRPPLSKRSRPRPSCELTTLFVRQPVVLGGCSLRGRSLPELGREVRRVLPTWSCPSSDSLEVWCFFSDRTMATGSRS